MGMNSMVSVVFLHIGCGGAGEEGEREGGICTLTSLQITCNEYGCNTYCPGHLTGLDVKSITENDLSPPLRHLDCHKHVHVS